MNEEQEPQPQAIGDSTVNRHDPFKDASEDKALEASRLTRLASTALQVTMVMLVSVVVGVYVFPLQ